jgi:type II secretory ATPase GspE/PulE/Tfp pilus assembly ATPase PilB-like protein
VVVRTRVDGLCDIYQRLPYKYKYALPSRIKIMADLDISERRKPQDGKINFRKFGPADVELRVATMPTVGNLEDVVIRLLGTGDPVTFDDLGLTVRNRRVFERAIRQPYGLILVVGPTGSGKTTTLHSAIALINTPQVKIWTAEDPVEITQEGLRQVQVNPRLGLTFATTLRSFLRLDPDIIMVGEMRDHETASMGIEASLTGHLVLSTLHTTDAPSAVTRLLNLGIEPYLIAAAVNAVLAQRLVRKICPNCKEPCEPADHIKHVMADAGVELTTAYRGKGCSRCRKSGFSGRIGVFELLVPDSEMRDMITRMGQLSELRQRALHSGMISLRTDGFAKVKSGITTVEEVLSVTAV